MAKPKYKIIKVLVQEEYLVEMYNEEHTEINGWTFPEVIKEWFEDFPLNQFHASRDVRKAGRKYISSSIEDLEKK